MTAFLISLVVGVGHLNWNHGYRHGPIGSCIGTSILKFRVVGEKSGQPIGFDLSVVRQIAHVADAVICYSVYLFPCGMQAPNPDNKIMTTVCLPKI